MSLVQCLEFIAADELVEITPKSISLRKRILDGSLRAKASRKNAYEIIVETGAVPIQRLYVLQPGILVSWNLKSICKLLACQKRLHII
jgi:hypothetical protein